MVKITISFSGEEIKRSDFIQSIYDKKEFELNDTKFAVQTQIAEYITTAFDYDTIEITAFEMIKANGVK